MKKTILIFSLGLSNLIAAQSNQDLKKEINDINIKLENLKIEIQKIKDDNIYYKETLNLNTKITDASANNVEFSILSAKGSKKDKTLVITYLYKNISNNIRKGFQGMKAYCVDDRGNQNNTNEVLANKTQSRVENIQPGIPMKGFVNFKLNEIDFPIIKLLSLDFYIEKQDKESLSGKMVENVVFKNIPVIWE